MKMKDTLAACMMLSLAAAAAPSGRLLLVGDSTLQRRGATAKQGSWGDALGDALRPEITIMNCAIGGRSTRTYMPEWTTNVAAKVRAGDRVIIQFGHNDMSKASDPKAPERRTDPQTEYKDNLRRFIRDVRARGGEPILCTSITLYLYLKDGTMRKNPLERWVKAMREVAEETGTPLVDMNALTLAALRKAGAEGSLPWYMKSVNGKDWAHPTKAGARKYAELFLKDVRARDLAPMRGLLKPASQP